MDKNHCDKNYITFVLVGVDLASNFVYRHPSEKSGTDIPRIVAAKVIHCTASSGSAIDETCLFWLHF